MTAASQLRHGINGLSKSYGDLPVFRDFSLELPSGEVTVILGPSGCGKTTLLRCISGLEARQAGSFPGLEDRQLSMVFQEPRLLPWATVGENLSLVAAGRRAAGAGGESTRRIRELLEAVELQQFEGAYPGELSGGMAQRVALARAFVVSAEALLLDEPFRALDIALRIRMYEFFRRLWRRERPTTVLVTHNVEEAVLQGDHIVLLSARPTQLSARFENPVPYENRHLDEPQVRELQTRIYTLLLEAADSSARG